VYGCPVLLNFQTQSATQDDRAFDVRASYHNSSLLIDLSSSFFSPEKAKTRRYEEWSS
jgi:hypothetical protein